MRNLIALVILALAVASCSRTGLGRGTPPAGETPNDTGVDVETRDTANETIGFDASEDARLDLPPDVPEGVCGDGVLAAGEACDDGEFNSDTLPNSCRTDCQLPSCGDGVVDDGEPCDDGNGVENDDCSNDCLRPAIPCEPCEAGIDCGRAIDQCSRLLDGNYCTIACPADGCPAGTVCRRAQATSGAESEQCVPELNVCEGCFDRDDDGYGIGLECLDYDCNDDNPRINPGAIEICNDVDDDCDLENDEGCPPDLIVDGEEIELSGAFLFDRVDVLNGGVVRVQGGPEDLLTTDCSPEGPGCLKIQARVIFVRSGSSIDASGAGFCEIGTGDEAGFGPGLANVGPGGGAYGGAGGSGPGLSGGEPYGSVRGEDIEMGSPGRGFFIAVPGFDGRACDDLTGLESEGGAGGGCIQLEAPDIFISGTLRADGRGGEIARDSTEPSIVDGGAGGSGGGIYLGGDRISLEAGAIVQARGGAGGAGATYRRGGGDGDQCIGNGGGGGGGGRVKIVGGTVVNAASVDARGGDGSTGPQNPATGGQDGTVWIP